MKPLKLVMSAFGPYSRVQEIDFNKLDGSNIFLITGPTGAGKTTIFDAISYALYGETSGSTREVDTLRSDFAKGDIETFVELEFEFRNNIYKIKRSPTQFINKKRGDGLKEEKAKAELYLPNGKVITKVKEATDKIQEILGIDKEQFKQIVMIPQGEFKKLLLADSKERGIIFRKIFGTYDYERIQNALREKADSMKKGVQAFYDEIKVNVKGIKSKDDIVISDDLNTKQYLDIIKEILDTDKKLQEEEKLKLIELKNTESKLKESIIKAEQINELIKQQKDVDNKLKSLNLQKEEIEKERIILEKAKRARLVEPSELLYNQKLEDKKNKQDNLVKLNKDLVKSSEELKIARGALEVALKNEPIKEALNKEIISLNEKLEKLKGVEGKADEIKALEAKYAYIDESLKAKEIMLKNEQKAKEDIESNIKALIVLEKKLVESENTQKNIKEKIEKLLDLYKEIDKYKASEALYNEKCKEREVFDKKYASALEMFELYDTRFKLAQAGILAQSLEAGKECPVCGSVNHPNKAKLLKDTPTENEINLAKEELELRRAERDKFYSGIEVQKNIVKINKENIENKIIIQINEKFGLDFKFNDELQGLVKSIGKEVREELTNIEKEIIKIKDSLSKVTELEKNLSIVKETIDKLEKDINDSREYKLKLVSDISKENETLKVVINEIPEEFRDKNKLSEHIESKVKRFKEIQEKIESAKKSESDASNLNSSIKAKVTLASEDIKKIECDIEVLLKTYEDKIRENKFTSIEEYKECKLQHEIIINIENNINKFDDNFKILQSKSIELNEKCKDLSSIDTLDLNKNLIEVTQSINNLEKEINIIFARYDNNKHRYKQIQGIYEKIKVLEDKYSIVGQLANYANGKTSPYITFESYVLAVYFKQIIDAANIRLSKMTSGRFLLKRKEDKGKGAGQKGLDLEVFDNYTGKLRGVSTLSGGESFKASLALALGLSDIIQMNAGGIKLDTMFIDEGFGTLDPESLDNAVSCLLELQQGGRLVGVISHVPELKERIERKLTIIPTPEGSKASFNN